VARFTGEFLSFLAAADLSISMAGYNTSMNLLAAGVPSLVYPFGQNREQRLRAKKLAAVGSMTVVDNGDLEPLRLAELMKGSLKEPRTTVSSPVSLDGAQETARWLEAWCGERGDLV
jgi:predicted glycosyltransferase